MADLATLTRVQQSVPGATGGSDAALLSVLLSGVSRAIEKYCKRVFGSASYDELAAVDHAIPGRIVLSRFPVQSVESVRHSPFAVMTVQNTSTLNQQARVVVTSTGLSLVAVAAGVRTTTTAGLTWLIGAPVTAVTVTASGSAYTSAPTVTFTGGGGSGAAGTAVISGGVVVSVTVTAGGSGYTSAPTVGFISGGGSGAAATATVPTTPATVATLAAAVTALGNGWVGTASSAYGGWPASDLYAPPLAGDGATSGGALNAASVAAPLFLHVGEASDFAWDYRGWIDLRTLALSAPAYWNGAFEVEGAGRLGNYRVQYTAGFTTIPADVQEAACLWVAELYYLAQRDPTAASTLSTAGAAAGYVPGVGMPDRVRGMLAPYRLRGV
jgi:hypothetical protein